MSELATIERAHPLQQQSPHELTRSAWALATALSKARAIPKALVGSPESVLLIMQASQALDIPVFAALTQVNVIQGKAEASAELMLSLVHRAGHRARHGGSRTEAWCEITRADDPGFTYRETFTLDDAAQAGLCEIIDAARGLTKARSDKGDRLPWETYTRTMLRWRAISQCASYACPEVLLGVRYVYGETGGPIPASELIEAEASYPPIQEGPLQGPSSPAQPSEPPAEGNEPAAAVVDEAEPENQAGGPEAEPDIQGFEWLGAWYRRLAAARAAADKAAVIELGNEALNSGRPDAEGLADQARDAYRLLGE